MFIIADFDFPDKDLALDLFTVYMWSLSSCSLEDRVPDRLQLILGSFLVRKDTRVMNPLRDRVLYGQLDPLAKILELRV